MSILAIAYLMQYLECIIGKWMMLGHQFGYNVVQGIPIDKTYMNMWTSDPLFIPNVQNVHEILPLMIGGCMIWHYLLSMSSFISSFCAERALATIFSEDYEKHRRTYISMIILTISHTTTSYLSYKCLIDQIDFLTTCIGCVICVAASCVTFVTILIINLKISQLQSKTGNIYFYTLGFRFQVKENIRALKLAYRVLVCIGVYIIVVCIFLFTLYFDVFPPINLLLIFLLENFLYLNPLCICSVIFFYIEPWKKAFLKGTPMIARFFNSKSKHAKPSDSKSLGCQQTTDLYFQQLKSSW